MLRSKKERGRKRHSPSPPLPLPHPIQFSFFKVLIGDFSDVLFIPPTVACNLKYLTKKYVYVEDSDGHCWTVKMSMVDGSLAFQNGWRDFVSAHSMSFGEFVIFTYYGGWLFKARIFGTSSVERVNFQLKSSNNRCPKEMCFSELSPNSVRFPKRKKVHQESEGGHQLSTTEDMLRLNREEKTAPCDLPKFARIEIDYISEGIAQVPRAVKPQRVSDAIVEEELNITSSSDLVKLDRGNLETNKRIRNSIGTTGQGAVCLNGGRTLLSTQAAGKTSTKVQHAYAWPINTHSHIIEVLPGTRSDSQMQGMEVDGKVRTKVNVYENNSHNLGRNDSDDDKVTAVSNLKDANCCPKMEEIPIEPKGGPDMEIRGNEDSVCKNELVNFCSETNEQSENVPAVPSTTILGCTKGKKECMMPTSQAIGDPQANGISRDALTDSDLKDVIPRSDWGSQTIIERTDSIDMPSRNSIFSVRLSDDVQSSLKLPEVLAFQRGEIINERKVVVLRNASMKCWPVLYHESISYVEFIGGWMDFARANNICRGDNCEFELVDKKEHIFQVQIKKA